MPCLCKLYTFQSYLIHFICLCIFGKHANESNPSVHLYVRLSVYVHLIYLSNVSSTYDVSRKLLWWVSANYPIDFHKSPSLPFLGRAARLPPACSGLLSVKTDEQLDRYVLYQRTSFPRQLPWRNIKYHSYRRLIWILHGFNGFNLGADQREIFKVFCLEHICAAGDHL